MMLGIVLSIIGLLIFSGGVSLLRSGNYDGGIFWPVVGFIVIIIGIIKTISGYQESVRRNNEKHLRNESERRSKERREENERRAIEMGIVNLQNIQENSQKMVAEMPQLILKAEHHLNKAEEEFTDGVFAPFWDQIEGATNRLAEYYQKIEVFDKDASSYREQSTSLIKKGIKVPAFTLPIGIIPDANPTAIRLSQIVRKAQKNFQFSTIYEQRKTNKLLYEGFRSLGDAIYSLENSISSAIMHLSDRLEVSLNEIIYATNENAQAQSQYYKDMKMLASASTAANREFQRNYMHNQNELKQMVDNIQRGRKPSLL